MAKKKKVVCCLLYYNMHVYKLVSNLGKLSKELDTVFLPSFGCYRDDNLVGY